MTAESPQRLPAPPTRRVRPLRLLAMVAAGVALILCLGGVGVAVNLYDEATAIDRGEPDVIVDNYLRAYLVERNDVRAESLECAQDAGLEPIHAFRADIEHREQGFEIKIMVSWGALSVAPKGEERLVTTDISRTIMNAAQSVQTWEFTVVDEGGWKVCGARSVS